MTSPLSGPWIGVTLALFGAVLGLSPRRQTPAPFDFSRTMRVDYFHSGGPKTGESVSLDRVVNDGPWPGSHVQRVDQTNLGRYLFEVRDGGKTVYSRGFASVYGECETTAEATKINRTFHESLRFPWPLKSVTVVLSRRGADFFFNDTGTTE